MRITATQKMEPVNCAKSQGMSIDFDIDGHLYACITPDRNAYILNYEHKSGTQRQSFRLLSQAKTAVNISFAQRKYLPPALTKTKSKL